MDDLSEGEVLISQAKTLSYCYEQKVYRSPTCALFIRGLLLRGDFQWMLLRFPDEPDT